MADKKVAVTIGSTITVDTDPVVLRVNNDKAKWVNDTGIAFSIVLPTGYPTPQCGAQGSQYICTSDAVSSVTTSPIKYTVKSGTKEPDPEIDVVP